MTTPSTHPSLLLRLRDWDDAPAWREFERRYGDLVTRIALRSGLDLTDAEDVAQNVLVGLSRAMRGFDYDPQRGSFRAYLRRAVRNELGRHFARDGRHGVPWDGVTNEPGEDPFVEQFDREWRAHVLRVARRRVRGEFPDHYLPVFDELVGGARARDVAIRRELTPDGVRKIKQRVVEALARAVADQLEGEA